MPFMSKPLNHLIIAVLMCYKECSLHITVIWIFPSFIEQPLVLLIVIQVDSTVESQQYHLWYLKEAELHELPITVVYNLVITDLYLFYSTEYTRQLHSSSITTLKPWVRIRCPQNVFFLHRTRPDLREWSYHLWSKSSRAGCILLDCIFLLNLVGPQL